MLNFSRTPKFATKSPRSAQMPWQGRDQTCFMPPMTDPLTCVQLMLPSSFSSTSPMVQTLSPRTRYTPKGISCEGSSLSGVSMIRSVAPLSTYSDRLAFDVSSCRLAERTRFVELSHAASVPTRILESAVTIRTFSTGQAWLAKKRFAMEHGERTYC